MAAAGLVGLALCGSPLLGVWGPESAFLLGVALPPLAAALGARLSIACRGEYADIDMKWLLYLAVSTSVAMLAIPVAILAVNQLWVRNCAPPEGFIFIILGPGFGVALAALVGVAIGAAIPRARAATAAAVSMPIAGLLWSAYTIYATPAMFAYSHFFGYFHGSLYDEEISIPKPLVSLRVATVLIGSGVVLLMLGAYNSDRRRLTIPSLRADRLGRCVWALIFFILAALGEVLSPQFGLRTSKELIAAELGGRAVGRRCTAIVPRELDRAEAGRLAEDCDFRVEQMESWLGVRQKERVTAYFFRSAEQKRELTGAAQTNIAKPWRNEVYLLLRPWPHPVLAHEIAHVVAKNAARGPFGVAGALGGWWPNPILIEGLAVAAAWDPDEGLTPHQWARAMLQLGLAPRLRELAGAGFLTQPKQRAYTLAGSLMRYVAEKRGAETLRRVYARGDFASALQVSEDQLERDWRGYMDKVPLVESALDLARVRFYGGSIFSAVCPHQTARWRAELREDTSALDNQAAAADCRKILEIDPSDLAARAALVAALARAGKLDAARDQLRELIGKYKAPAPLRAAAFGALGEAAWRNHQDEQALNIFRSLLKEPLAKDALRQLEVKTLALEAGGGQDKLLFELMVGQNGAGADGAYAVYLAHELGKYRKDGLSPYLEARQLYFARRFKPAAELLAEANRLGLPSERFATEAARLQAIASFAAGDLETSARLWTGLAASSDAAQGAEAADWLARIKYVVAFGSR